MSVVQLHIFSEFSSNCYGNTSFYSFSPISLWKIIWSDGRTEAELLKIQTSFVDKTRDRGAVGENYMQMSGKKKATIFQFGLSFFGINYSHLPFITSLTRILYPYLWRDGEITDMLFISVLFKPSKYFCFLYICRCVISVFYLHSIPFPGLKKPTKEERSNSDQNWLVGLQMVSAF